MEQYKFNLNTVRRSPIAETLRSSIQHTLFFYNLYFFLFLNFIPSADYISDIMNALSFHKRGSYNTAITASAMQIYILFFFNICHRNRINKIIQWKVDSIFDMSFSKFSGATNIHYY